MRLAAIDVGTNSVRLLVADVLGQRYTPLVREMETTRLGKGIISTGRLSEAGKEKTIRAVQSMKGRAVELGACVHRVMGTSAFREATDGLIFARELSGACGLKVDILSLEEEAMLSYKGASLFLPVSGNALVFDLGGGSCEIIWPEDGLLRTVSLKAGAVYLTESFFEHDPPLASELESARLAVREILRDYKLTGRPVVGVGGTVTNLAAINMGMVEYDANLVHGYTLSRESVRTILVRLAQNTLEERRSIPGIQKERADILTAGTLFVDELLDHCGASCLTVSEEDLLAGSLLQRLT